MHYAHRAENRFLNSLPYIDDITRVVFEPLLGRTVIATASIDAGQCLGVYPGAKLTLQAFLDKHELLDHAVRYAFSLSENTVIDPTDIFGYVSSTPQNHLALINEAPPDSRINIIPIASKQNIWFTSIRHISAGEPLYTFYGLSYLRHYPHGVEKLYRGTEFTQDEIELLREIGRSHKWLQQGVKSLLDTCSNCKELQANQNIS